MAASRWTLLAHMAVNAAGEGREYQETTLGNYLEQAYRCGIKDASVERLEDLTMPIVDVSRADLEKIFPPKELGAKKQKRRGGNER